jgi:outer membrane protein OmpA-like peptidoglycan-associated protein
MSLLPSYQLFRIILCSAIAAFANIAYAQAPATLSDQSQAYQQTLAKDPDNVEALLGQAALYVNEQYRHYNPDTAFLILKKARRAFRQLKPRQQKRLDEASLGNKYMRALRDEISEKGFEFHLEKESSQAMTFYMDHYSRLPYELVSKASNAFLKFRLFELQKMASYDSLKYFAITQRENLQEFQPELIPLLEDAVFETYFSNKDSTVLNDLFQLLKDYPDVAARVDAPLSKALAKFPLITRTESEIRGLDRRRLPKTIRVIYLYHYYTGEWSDLIGFQNRYPEYADSFNLQRAITVAKLAPDLDVSYTAERYEIYDNYIRLAAPVHKAYRALQQMIAENLERGEWKKARSSVDTYSDYFGKEDLRIEKLKTALDGKVEGIKPVALEGIANSADGEYAPVISADGQRLYFCRNIEGNEEIYVSSLENGAWAQASGIRELNTEENHEAPLAVSTDGTTLMIYNNGIVQYTEKNREGWSSPRQFFSDQFLPEWQGVTTFSADGKVAIFAAKTINIIGARNDNNIDLFISFRQKDGSWGPPVNLGTTLNTPFEDRCPFLHPDMRTMYFSSSGHGGMGKLDVFMTTRIGDSWTEWSPPLNLGKEINLPGNDWGYRISTDGKTAYFSATTLFNKEDLFEIAVPERFRPEPVSTISGKINRVDEVPIEAVLTIEDMETGETIKTVKPDPQTGQFIITLPSGKLYSYTVTGQGLYPISNNLDLRKEENNLQIIEQVEVPTIEQIQKEGMVLPLKNLFFDTDKHQIKPASYLELNRLADLVSSYQLRVEIAGHTDNVGSADYNIELSQNRADAARLYLIEQGVAPEQIKAVGYGLRQPVATNKTEEGRALNRRVEIRFQPGQGE